MPLLRFAVAGDVTLPRCFKVSMKQQTIRAVARQVCLQPRSGSQYASLASASRRISNVDFPLYMLPVSVT